MPGLKERANPSADHFVVVGYQDSRGHVREALHARHATFRLPWEGCGPGISKNMYGTQLVIVTEWLHRFGWGVTPDSLNFPLKTPLVRNSRPASPSANHHALRFCWEGLPKPFCLDYRAGLAISKRGCEHCKAEECWP